MKIKRKIVVLIVILLLISFGWHIINTNHVHYEAQYGGGIEAVFHDDDQKWLVLFLAFLFALSFTRNKFLPRLNLFIKKINTPIPKTPIFIDSIELVLQSGNLHPKVYGC